MDGHGTAATALASGLCGLVCGAGLATRTWQPEPEPAEPAAASADDQQARQDAAGAAQGGAGQGDAAQETEWDTPGLADRVLRKAETVVQGRTSRFLIVVERCVDSHNYSAIIRTGAVSALSPLFGSIGWFVLFFAPCCSFLSTRPPLLPQFNWAERKEREKSYTVCDSTKLLADFRLN